MQKQLVQQLVAKPLFPEVPKLEKLMQFRELYGIVHVPGKGDFEHMRYVERLNYQGLSSKQRVAKEISSQLGLAIKRAEERDRERVHRVSNAVSAILRREEEEDIQKWNKLGFRTHRRMEKNAATDDGITPLLSLSADGKGHGGSMTSPRRRRRKKSIPQNDEGTFLLGMQQNILNGYYEKIVEICSQVKEGQVSEVVSREARGWAQLALGCMYQKRAERWEDAVKCFDQACQSLQGLNEVGVKLAQGRKLEILAALECEKSPQRSYQLLLTAERNYKFAMDVVAIHRVQKRMGKLLRNGPKLSPVAQKSFQSNDDH